MASIPCMRAKPANSDARLFRAPHRDARAMERLRAGKRVLARESRLGAKLGFSREQLADLNRKSIALLASLRDEFETPQSPMPISGNIGPRGDGYFPDQMMSGQRRAHYHALSGRAVRRHRRRSGQRLHHDTFRRGDRRRACGEDAGMPVVISFTTETDGRLPSGETLARSDRGNRSATSGAPAYYMINCAHPTHFEDALRGRKLGAAHPRPARQFVDAQPCRTRQFARSRYRRSGRSRPPLSRACAARSAPASTFWAAAAAPIIAMSSRSACLHVVAVEGASRPLFLRFVKRTSTLTVPSASAITRSVCES